MTHAYISVFLAVAHLEMRLPPKIFVIQSVIFVEQEQVVGQLSHVFKFGDVDERMRWRYHFVVVVKSENDGYYWAVHHSEEPDREMN